MKMTTVVMEINDRKSKDNLLVKFHLLFFVWIETMKIRQISNMVMSFSINFNRKSAMLPIRSFGTEQPTHFPFYLLLFSLRFSYDWSGQPLILTKLTGNQPSTCRYCQSPLIFEFQLMPALVNFLKIDNQTALEFGTVIVYTCSKNCWQDSSDELYRLENVFLQTDPDQNLFD